MGAAQIPEARCDVAAIGAGAAGLAAAAELSAAGTVAGALESGRRAAREALAHAESRRRR